MRHRSAVLVTRLPAVAGWQDAWVRTCGRSGALALVVSGAALVGVLSGCGAGATTAASGEPAASVPAATVAATPSAAVSATPGEGLGKAEACRRFTEIESGSGMLDDTSASDLAELAGQVRDPALAAAIAAVGKAVADNDPSAPDAAVRAACAGT